MDRYPEPQTLQFDQLDEGMLADVMDAALRLGLPFVAKGRGITVTVGSPRDCWNLGIEYSVSRQRREKREARKRR